MLRTARLDLVPLSMQHVDLLLELDADPEVMRYISGGAPTNRTDMERIIRRNLGSIWAAFSRHDGAFVGWFELASRGVGEYELGYRLRREVWGAGIATEGGRMLIDLAFSVLGATRVFAQTMAVNAGSRRVMAKCGLRYARTFHAQWHVPIPGDEHGDVEYEVLAEQYRSA